ncbi:unnamed protein product [Bursaphelenchus xylophilus]|uniref:(pine wood nematode) hypothetical protein n=1 Tax=Bursaphelenchus xylophilus TaxID=6326 RepID=A0A7I8X3X4_BURXY|nr:unnamed protein product [Bursaphelenchus xylophilus]CAG9131288.1 unnamed protein product [Bursaphelenchus xylophilus]
MDGGDLKAGENVERKLEDFIGESRARAEAAEQRQAAVEKNLDRLIELLNKTATLQAAAAPPSPQQAPESSETSRQRIDFAELMFLDMRLPSLSGREKSSDIARFFYKFKAGTKNMSSSEKTDLLEAKLNDQAARIFEHCKLSSSSGNFDEVFESFEKEVKARTSDNKDWASIFLKPFYRRYDMPMREYADKITDMTINAFAGAPKEIMEKQMLSKFMIGLNHREAGNALAAEKHKNLPFEEMVQIAVNVYQFNKDNEHLVRPQQSIEADNNFSNPNPALQDFPRNSLTTGNRQYPEIPGDNRNSRAGPWNPRSNANPEIKEIESLMINKVENRKDTQERKARQETFRTYSDPEKTDENVSGIEFGDLETLFAEPEISGRPTKVHLQTDYTLELSKSVFMSWSHEQERKYLDFEEILDNSVYKKWFNTQVPEERCSKIGVSLRRANNFGISDKINFALFLFFVPWCQSLIQSPIRSRQSNPANPNPTMPHPDYQPHSEPPCHWNR